MEINKRGVNNVFIILIIVIGVLLIGAGVFLLITSKYGSVLNKLKFASETDATYFNIEDIDGGVKIVKYTGDDEIVVIPEKIDGKYVISVGEFAFVNNMKVKGIKLPDSISVIESEAFENCLNLEVFISGKGLRTISSYAFNYCKKLNTIKLNDGLEVLEISCFSNNNFSNIYIPASVTTMSMPISTQQPEKITIMSKKGSEAETWANSWGFVFEEVK